MSFRDLGVILRCLRGCIIVGRRFIQSLQGIHNSDRTWRSCVRKLPKKATA